MRLGDCARAWFRAFLEWSTVIVGAGAIFDILYHIDTWWGALTGLEVLTDAAVELLVAFVAVAIVATVVAVLWILARARDADTGWVSDLSTALAALTVAALLAVDFVVWGRSIGAFGYGYVATAFYFAACMLGAFAVIVGRWRRDGSLDSTSRGLQSVSRRSLLALVPISLGVALWGGVHYRRFDRGRRQSYIARSPGRPNVLLVTFDALAAQDMSLYGYRLPTTPEIDRFARDAIVFDHAYSASTFTTPAVASWLTGLQPPEHGIVRLHQRVPVALRGKSMVRALHEQGYRTGAVVANPAAHPVHLGLDRDFDFLPPPPLRWRGPIQWTYHFGNTDLGWRASDFIESRIITSGVALRPSLGCTTAMSPALAFDQALGFLERSDEPFFLWVHLFTPHWPYLPPPPFRGKFLAGKKLTCLADFDRLGPNGSPFAAARQPVIDTIRLRYDEFIAYADDAFGAFMATAEERRLLAHTAVILSADHGESFDHGYWGHLGSAAQGVVRVPLAVRLPDRRGAGLRVAGVSGGIDLFPTILDLAGIATPDWTEGRSLRPMWEDEGTAGRRRYAIALPDLDQGFPGIAAVMDGAFKYVETGGQDLGQLYNLAADPNESHNLAAENGAAVAALRQQVALAMRGTAWATKS
jgi:arylsulfatase A-like enzyme